MASKKIVRKNKALKPKRKAKVAKIYYFLGVFGILLVLVSQFYLNLQRRKYSFASTPTVVDYVRDRNYPTRIEIPKLKLDLPVEPGYIYKGIWGVSDSGATHLRQSAAPGETGNIVIYGHNKRSVFGQLNRLAINDVILVDTSKGKFLYEVKKILTVTPNDVDLVTPTNDPILTIYTCTGLLDTMRLVVQAKPVI